MKRCDESTFTTHDCLLAGHKSPASLNRFHCFILFSCSEYDRGYLVNLVTCTRTFGKRSHDVRLVAVMLTHQVTHLLTLNPDDFSGFPEIEVVHPQAIA